MKKSQASFFFNLFIYGCVGSSFLCEGLLQLRQAGATPHRGARASHHCGLSCCGAQAPDAQAQQLWPTGPAVPRHMGSSQTRARTHVPCIGRQTLNHCATREALTSFLLYQKSKLLCLGTSLVAQWLRIRLPMQGTRVRSLVWEDPTCRGATKPMRHNY